MLPKQTITASFLGHFFWQVPEGDYGASVGYLTFPFQTNGVDVASKIDELSTMLCAGRLSTENKQVLLVSGIYCYY